MQGKCDVTCAEINQQPTCSKDNNGITVQQKRKLRIFSKGRLFHKLRPVKSNGSNKINRSGDKGDLKSGKGKSKPLNPDDKPTGRKFTQQKISSFLKLEL